MFKKKKTLPFTKVIFKCLGKAIKAQQCENCGYVLLPNNFTKLFFTLIDYSFNCCNHVIILNFKMFNYLHVSHDSVSKIKKYS